MGGGSSEDLQPDRYRVAVGGVVENYTKWPLLLLAKEVKSGKITLPLGNVFPGVLEGFSSRKASWTATGSWVRYSFQVDDDILAHIMYSAPFNFDFFKNKMAVAMCGADDHERKCRHLDAKSMYYGDSTFVDRRDFFDNGLKTYEASERLENDEKRREIEEGNGNGTGSTDENKEDEYVKKCFDNICMVGAMESDHRPTIRVRVYPKSFHDLPYSVKAKGRVSVEKYQSFIKSLFPL